MWVDLSYALLFSKLRYFRNHVNCILLQDSFAFGDIASYSVNLDSHLIGWRAHGAGSASLITDENSLMTATRLRAFGQLQAERQFRVGLSRWPEKTQRQASSLKQA